MTMADTAPVQGETSLVRRVKRAERRHLIGMLGLMAPSVVVVALLFVLPVVLFMYRSADNSAIHDQLPNTAEAAQHWNGEGEPSDAFYEAILRDLSALSPQEAAVLGRNINYMHPGMRSLLTRTKRDLPQDYPGTGARAVLVDIDERWADRDILMTLRQHTGSLTAFHLLSALDLRLSPDGSVTAVSDQEAIFLELFFRTFWISAVVTVLCLLIGYPVAYVMATSSETTANFILMGVLVPFWTSLLVRTTAWVILLQTNGLVNDSLQWLRITDGPIQLIYNKTGIYIAMVHVLVPYMILPLYSVMRNIQQNHLRAAASLGANPLVVFLTVFLPLSGPGIAAGATLVFILSIGFYITPALVGGPGDQMIGYFIAYFTNSSINWSLAASLGTYLLLMVALVYLAIGRLIGLDRLKVR